MATITPAPRPETTARIALRWLAAVLMAGAGLNHFLNPAMYVAIIPPGFPSPRLLVLVSGVAELAGGLGLLVRPLRRAAGWGLILLLVAVLPANVYVALHPERFPPPARLPWLWWVRLPLQAVFIAWVWWVALAPAGNEGDDQATTAARRARPRRAPPAPGAPAGRAGAR